MKTKNIIQGLMALAVLGSVASLNAQDYDDIYYKPKAKKNDKVKTTTVTNYTPTADYAAADTYTGSFSTSPMVCDIDEYNRQGKYKYADTLTVNADTLGEFLYTRRLERFHNPDVVTNTGDDELIDYYYSQPSSTSTDINIYVNADPFYYGGWYSPYYYNSLYYPYLYSWRYYNPYYWSSWDPWYNWGWSSWNPWYNWGWGPSYYPPRPPHHGPGHVPGHNWRPTSPGASRPHASGSGSGYRPGSSGSYGGGIPSVGNRPGGMGTGRYNGSTSRPGNKGNKTGTAGSYRPNKETNTASGSSTRRNNSSSNRNNSYNSNRNHSTGTAGSYNGGSRSSYRSSGSSSFGGGRSSYSGGGGRSGGSRGGGGRHR